MNPGTTVRLGAGSLRRTKRTRSPAARRGARGGVGRAASPRGPPPAEGRADEPAGSPHGVGPLAGSRPEYRDAPAHHGGLAVLEGPEAHVEMGERARQRV